MFITFLDHFYNKSKVVGYYWRQKKKNFSGEFKLKIVTTKHLEFVVKNIVNVELLKKKKKTINKKIHDIFHNNWVDNRLGSPLISLFYYHYQYSTTSISVKNFVNFFVLFSSKSIINITLLFTIINLPYISIGVKKNIQNFCVYRISKFFFLIYDIHVN